MKEGHFKFPHSPLKIFTFILTAVFFVLVSTFIISSAKGYRIEFEKYNIVFTKTGTIIVTSQPAGGKIYINGKLYKKNSGTNLFSTKINGLVPGTYNLRIEKEGYLNWEKNLEVKAETISWANYAVLFPKEKKEEVVINQEILFTKASKDQKKMAFLVKNEKGEKELIVIDSNNLEKSKITLGINKLGEIQEIDFAPDNSKILLREKLADGTINFLVINVFGKEQEPLNITALFKLPFEKIVWNSNDTSSFFGLKEGSIFKINTENKTVSASLMDNVISFDIGEDRSIYYARNVGTEINLWKGDLNGNGKQMIIKSLPKSKNYKIQTHGSKILITVNAEVRTVYLADKIGELTELKQISQDATFANWSPNGKRIVMGNEKNLWTYDLEKDKVIGVSENTPIENIIWDGNDRIYVKSQNKCLAKEFDGGNTVETGVCGALVNSWDNRNYFYVSKDEKTLNNLILYKR